VPHQANAPELRLALDDPRVIKIAHNASFELALMSTLGMIDFIPEQWRCTAVHALGLGLPGGLGAVAAELRLAEQKSDVGKALIRRFSMPPRVPGTPQPGPEDGRWFEFVEYCRQDVRTERAIAHHLEALRRLPDSEWALWHLDQRINQRGLPVDLALVRGAMAVDAVNRERATEAVRDLTGVANPGSRNQLLTWLASQEVTPDDLTAGTVKGLLSDDDLPERVREVLEHRQQLAASSTAKFEALARATGDDGRLRGTLKFNGAHTGRWSGQLFQPQNLPRGNLSAQDVETARAIVREGDIELLTLLYPNHSQVLGSLVRSTIIAPPGKMLVVADLSSIESVVLAWCAESQYLLDLFRDGRDPYKDFATRLFNIPYDQVTKQQRNLCKPATLGGGFGLGGPGLQAYAAGFGLVLSAEQAAEHVRIFRAAYPDIPTLWRELTQATSRAVAHPGQIYHAGRCRYHTGRGYLWCELPSGRFLAYREPRVASTMTQWGEREQLSYLVREGKHLRVNTFHGKLTENCLSGATRVLTREGWRRLDSLTRTDEVYDGEDFVSHKGLVFRGRQDCLLVDGVLMTADHEVMTHDGWQEASLIQGSYRTAIRYVDRDPTFTPNFSRLGMGVQMRLWEHQTFRGRGDKTAGGTTWSNHELWLLHETLDRRRQYPSRDVGSPGVCRMAQHDGSVSAANPSGLGELWRSGYRSVRTLARKVRALLGRHGANVSKRFGSGSQGQQRGLLTRELLVDYSEKQHDEQTGYDSRRGYSPAIGRDGGRAVNPLLPEESRDGPAGPQSEHRAVRVYDILNAGPRHRFVVLGDSGPFIVHNCVQAIARDILASGIRRACADPRLEVISHIHDEVVTLADSDDTGALDRLIQHLTTVPAWADGLPLKAAGWVGPVYKKD
jgi:DNA polymerase